MQGQRGTVGSLPETLDFDLGSSSNNTAMDQQICWNNMCNPSENHIQDYLLPSEMDIAFNSMSRERQSLNRWRSNEASSSNVQNDGTRDKLELGWPSSGPRLEAQRHEPVNNNTTITDNSANLMFPQSSSTNHSVQPSLNLGFAGHSGSSSQPTQFPNSFKFSVSENEQSRLSNADRFLLPSSGGSAGFLVGENDGRQGSMDRGQVSCKRKAIEGPSSSSGNCSYFQRSDSNARPGLSTAQISSGSGLSIGNPRLGLGFPDPNVSDNNPESFHRNLRLRTSLSTTQQNSAFPSILSAGSSARAARRSAMLASQSPMTLLPVDHALELRPISSADNMRNPSQLHAIDVPLPQTAHPLRWSGGASGSRTGGPSSSSVAFNGRDSLPGEELSSRSMARALPDHPIPAAELRNLIRHSSSRSLAAAAAASGGSINVPSGSSGASTSRAGPSSNANPALRPAWQPQQIPQHHPRRFSEYLRRSLFPTVGSSESVGHGSNYVSLRPGQPGQPSSSPEMANPHHQPHHARLASWLDRHNDNGLGIHYSLRALGAGGENSTRLVSEIRNVLGIIRRGESLRFEDVMILDPAVFAGMADMHDRHRDMRLDVDNMSYEELLALEERIGNVSTGLSEETVLKCLKQKKYTVVDKPQAENEPCSVCQEEYNEGEDIGTLDCGHDFHRDCVKQWLTQKNLCPICKTTALKP